MLHCHIKSLLSSMWVVYFASCYYVTDSESLWFGDFVFSSYSLHLQFNCNRISVLVHIQDLITLCCWVFCSFYTDFSLTVAIWQFSDICLRPCTVQSTGNNAVVIECWYMLCPKKRLSVFSISLVFLKIYLQYLAGRFHRLCEKWVCKIYPPHLHFMSCAISL